MRDEPFWVTLVGALITIVIAVALTLLAFVISDYVFGTDVLHEPSEKVCEVPQ